MREDSLGSVQQDLDDETKIIILQAINGTVKKEYVEKILNIIDYFLFESNQTNKSNQLSILKKLARIDSKKVSVWLEERMGIENVVEYWAQLSIEGFIIDEFLY